MSKKFKLFYPLITLKKLFVIFRFKKYPNIIAITHTYTHCARAHARTHIHTRMHIHIRMHKMIEALAKNRDFTRKNKKNIT